MDVGISGKVPFSNMLSEDDASLRVTGLISGVSYFFEVYAVGNTSEGIHAVALHLQTLTSELG